MKNCSNRSNFMSEMRNVSDLYQCMTKISFFLHTPLLAPSVKKPSTNFFLLFIYSTILQYA